MDTNQIKKVCFAHSVSYHHHDKFASPPYKDDEDLKDAVIVVYSEQYGSWKLGICTDGSVVTPGSAGLAMLQSMIDRLKDKSNATT